MNKEELKNLITNKKGFPFYTDYWQQYFSRLSGEQCKEVLKLICNFALTGEQEVSQDFAADMVANSIITNITRDALKREKRISASRENGKSGGRPKGSNKPERTQSEPKETQSVIETQFESFWDLYGKKLSRPDAEKKFKTALKKDSFENVMAGLHRYIAARSADSQYWKNPSTWLHQECWKDDYQPNKEQPLEGKWSKY